MDCSTFIHNYERIKDCKNLTSLAASNETLRDSCCYNVLQRLEEQQETNIREVLRQAFNNQNIRTQLTHQFENILLSKDNDESTILDDQTAVVLRAIIACLRSSCRFTDTISFLNSVERGVRKILFDEIKIAVEEDFDTVFEEISTLSVQTIRRMTVKNWLNYLLTNHDVKVSQYIGCYKRLIDGVDGNDPMVVYMESNGRISQMELLTRHCYYISDVWTKESFKTGLESDQLVDAGKGVPVNGDTSSMVKTTFARYQGPALY